MTRAKRAFTTGLLPVVAVLVLSFQNCSPYQAVAPDVSVDSSASVAPGSTLTGVQVPVILASGHMGRTILSCDGGKTWVHDESDNDAARCWVTGDPNEVECDHHPSAGHGVDYDGSKYFYASFGWGTPGTIRRSVDGVHWETVYSAFAGSGLLAFGQKLVLLWGYYYTSDDGGATYTPVAQSPAGVDSTHIWNPRPYKFGEKAVAMSGEAAGVAVSSDYGVTWNVNTSVPKTWTNSGATYGNGLMVSFGTATPTSGTGTDLYTAVSTDGGLTWNGQLTAPNSPWAWTAGPIFDGTQFMAWAGSNRYVSTDGMHWTSAVISNNDTAIPPSWMQGTVTYDPNTHRYAMIMNLWQHFYAGQKAFWSMDGLTWTEVTSDHFTGGHPISSMVIGEADSSVCNQ